MKKYIVIIIFALIAAGIICGIIIMRNNHSGQDQQVVKYEEITMVLPTYGYVPDGMEQVTKELNRISIEKCGVKVNYIFTGSSELNHSCLMRLKAGEQIDLMPCLESDGLMTLMSEKLIAPLDELIDLYAPSINELFYPKIWDALRNDDQIYALPAVGSQSDWGGVVFNRDILETEGISSDSITDDIKTAKGTPVRIVDEVVSPLLYRFKESDRELPDGTYVSEKQLTPGLNGYKGIFSQMKVVDYDGYGNLFGVTLRDSDEIINLFETDEYREELELLKKWNNAGYIYHLRLSIDEDPAIVYSSKNRIGFFTSTGTYVENLGEPVENETTVYFPFIKEKLTADLFQVGTWVIPEASEHKDAAMKILNLMYTDEEYVKAYAHDNSGLDGYTAPLAWMFGNTLLTDKSYPETLLEKDHYKSMRFTKHFGFMYQPGENTDIVENLGRILEEYLPDIENGVIGDIQTTLDEMNKKLYDAGLTKIMEDKQAQLDAWIERH